MFKTLKALKARIRYLIDRAFAREFAGQLLLLFVLVVTVTVIGMTAIFVGLFSEENDGISAIPRDFDESFLDALWWSFNQVLYLQSFAEMYGATGWVLVYAFFLSLMGLGTLGILVSVISTTIDNRIEALRRGETPVLEQGHVLVLGWNNKIFSVLQQLAQLEPGIKAVILAPLEINDMQQALRVAGLQHEPITIILRNGNPSNRNELERVALDHASSIIILATDTNDSESIKLMVLLAAKDDWPDNNVPTLTSEIAHERNYELAKIAAKDRIQIISSAKVISKVIVQSVRNPGLSDIYNELLSTDKLKNSIYVQQMPECTDMAIETIAHRITDGIPIGYTWKKKKAGILQHTAALNPEPDYEIAEDEKLIVVARGLPVHYDATKTNHNSSSLTSKANNHTYIPQRVLVMGWTDMIIDILLELDAHALQGTEISIVSRKTPEEANKYIAQHQKANFKNLNLEFIEADATEVEVYAKINLSSFQSIVILADDRNAQDDIDTHTLSILLRLSNQRQHDKIHAHTIVELIDESNHNLIAGLGVDEIVISPKIISELLAQIARQEVLGPIYYELLSAGGVEISLRPASDYIELGTDCRYDDLIAAAQQNMEVTLGLRLAQDKGKILLNPPRDQIWQLGEDDQIIVLAQQLY